MAYTQELINEVKELYPDNETMRKLAESGAAMLGRYLDDNSPGVISVDTILLASTLEDLQKKARLEKRRLELYKKWCSQDPRPKLY